MSQSLVAVVARFTEAGQFGWVYGYGATEREARADLGARVRYRGLTVVGLPWVIGGS